MNQEIFVAIRCITYNHEPYIRQCLEGFVMQKTNFRFVAIVHDDASTDGTAAIVREFADKYPDIIWPIYETENQWSKRDGSLRRIMNKAIDETGCKYIAVCEGDDYWIDPLKLQKQVDYLEANPDCGIVYTDFSHVAMEDGLLNSESYQVQQHIKERFQNGFVFHIYLLNHSFIQTCTICYRRSLCIPSQANSIDTSLFMTIARQSKVYCLSEKTACYRLHSEGMMVKHSKYVSDITFQIKYDQFYYAFKDSKNTHCFYHQSQESKRAFDTFYAYAWYYLLTGKVRGINKLIYITAIRPLFLLKLIPLWCGIVYHKVK